MYQKSPKVDAGTSGTVAGIIEGEHLKWFKSILEEGQKQPDVNFIFVQGHFPVLFPVKRVKSSGIYMESDETSDFLSVMRDYGVNVYFAGEHHLNTVTKDDKSDLVQIVSRGNYFTNFLTVDVADDSVTVVCHNEVGEENKMYNYNYEPSGKLTISKDNGGEIKIDSSGELQVLDRSLPMLHFSFENIFSLKDRPIIGLGDLPGVRSVPIVSDVTIDKVSCTKSLPNVGALGMNYDAQTANIDLVPGVHGNAGSFSANSRAAVLGMGPHSDFKAISYSLWVKTNADGENILICYEGYWTKNNIMTLRLRNGRPEISYSASQQLRAKGSDAIINDNKWHHISVVMPHDKCLLSELLIYIDGSNVNTNLVGSDSVMELPSGGMISLGGFGYGNTGSDGDSREDFKGGDPFVGLLDDVYVWARSLEPKEVRNLASFPEPFALRSKLSYQRKQALCVGFGLNLNEIVLRNCNDSRAQEFTIDSLGYIRSVVFYQKCLLPASASSSAGTIVELADCEFDDQKFNWSLASNGLIEYNSDTELYLTVKQDNSLILRPITAPEVQNWDIVYEGVYPASYLTEAPSSSPSSKPSQAPTTTPTKSPSAKPSAAPTRNPTPAPTKRPTRAPTRRPTKRPTPLPTKSPSLSPSKSPSAMPSKYPTSAPTSTPSATPSKSPQPSSSPSMCIDRRDGYGNWHIGDGKYKNCMQAKKTPRLCNYEIISLHCPVACHLDCDALKCSDNSGEFSKPNGKTISCSDAISNPNLCLNSWFNQECKMSCFGSCAECADFVVPFESPSGVDRTCSDAEANPNLCRRDWFYTMCPVSCETCDKVHEPGAPETPTTECEDTNGAFENGGGITKYCTDAQEYNGLCGRVIYRKNCKKTCNTCDSVCVDSLGVKIGQKWRQCSTATSPNHKLCNKKKFKKACPKACGQC